MATIEKLKRINTDLAAENASFRSRLDALRCEAEHKKDCLRRSAHYVVALKEERREKEDNIVKLGSLVESLNADKKELKAAASHVRSDNDRLERIVQELREEISALKALRDEGDDQVIRLQREALDFQQEARDLRGTLARVRTALDQSRRERDHWKQQSLEATQHCSEMDERIAECGIKIRLLEYMMFRLTMRVKALELENAQLRGRGGGQLPSVDEGAVDEVRDDTTSGEDDTEWYQLTQRMAAIAASS
ncbi:conserved hypothetical protein [Perkinsus marinus ATCC 50983]|uniref:Uncharacterized protein n=3 Tax=Perkinsus marinus (strain ATCC 50983 / TXsc) TaxID=423536 RepID=C5M0V0_PERM5|nr:conserved hypothetical protein [Perkinsus marinus ATCC 50983]EEQ97458.1 conserved hypothetical protein [Perkinsus marinus ATCC 50983]|eukprot:XP_002764741.1 conserved hypothetical protein [Perkinsus marinus ATCC 50983]